VAPSAAGPGLKTELVKPGLYRIGGAAGQAVVRVGANGVVVVDPMAPGSNGALLAEIGRIVKTSDAAVRAVILTSGERDRAAEVGELLVAGAPVIVQRQALAQLLGGSTPTGAATPGSSFVTYDHDYQLRLGEVEVEVEHVGRGRTGADSIVVFRGLRVVAVGELFTTEAPRPDCASGGTFAGWAAAIDHLLWSDFDVAVPRRGAPVGKVELTKFKATLEALARRAASAPADASACLPRR
jgi:glyoxylase-like metal-dependent hydrolase (beta-lactamase superfamily II)